MARPAMAGRRMPSMPRISRPGASCAARAERPRPVLPAAAVWGFPARAFRPASWSRKTKCSALFVSMASFSAASRLSMPLRTRATASFPKCFVGSLDRAAAWSSSPRSEAARACSARLRWSTDADSPAASSWALVVSATISRIH